MSDIDSVSRRAFLGASVLLVSGLVLAAEKTASETDGAAKLRNSPAEPSMPRFPGAPQETMYGINANDARVVTRKQALCGSIGVARTCYAGMLPATWDPSKEGASPQYKCHVSFKADPAAVVAGQYDARIVGWLQSIPAGWRVYLTFWHEPNDELREGRFTATSFRAAWSRLSAVVHEVTGLSEGVLVQPVPVFMGYQVGLEGYWSDDWVPHPNEVAFLSWDIYGNPAGGSGLSGGYPTPQSCIDPCLEATERIGFGRWGVSEFNAPARTWDVDESARRTWLTNFHTYARSKERSLAPQLGAPSTLLLWEGRGANWGQTFGTSATWNWWQELVTSQA